MAVDGVLQVEAVTGVLEVMRVTGVLKAEKYLPADSLFDVDVFDVAFVQFE